MAVTPADTLRTLRARSARARLEASERARKLRIAVEALVRSRLPPEGRAWLIGSLAWGDFGERSDVDLVFDQVSAPETAAIEVELSRALGVAVDRLHLGDLSPEFRARVEREGVPLHAG